MWRRRGFPPRWETLAGDEGGEEEQEEEGGRQREGGKGERAEIMLPLPLSFPSPLSLALSGLR